MPGFAGKGEGDSTCSYGTGYLLKQVSAVRKEIPGVLGETDIEHIHRMRVATRRLRSALPLFSPCFPGKKIRRWRKGLRETAQALGEARDTDVQVAFLREYLSDLKSGGPAGNRAMLPAVIKPGSHPVPYSHTWYDDLSLPLRNLMRSLQSAFSRAGGYLGRILGKEEPATVSPPSEQPDPVPGTECVLLRKNQERARHQEGVEKAILRLERTGLLGEMERDFRRHEGKGGASTEVWRGIFATAFTSVTLHIDDLLAFSESLADPGKIREHHAMRIAVKRLRYTLEVWRDLFGDDLGKDIDTLKGLQDLLGDLHDCDVWIGYLPEFLREEELRCSAFFGNDDHFRSIVPGIEALIRERRERRRQLHETALTTWRDLAFRHFWDTLREKLLMPLTGRREGPFRIGLLANISGDAGALRRVLADGRSRGVSLFLNAGDTLGSPRASRETVEILRKEGILSVAGDRDRVIPGGVSPAGDGGVAGGRDAPERQSKITRSFIRALPTSLRLSFAGERVLLTHGSPASSTGCLDEKVPDGVLCQLAQEAGVSAIVTGNSPAPFERKVCDVLLVGPGSVAGIDGEAGPSSYAILEIVAGGRMTVSHHRIGPGETGLSGAPIPLPPLPTRDTTGA